MTPSRRPVLRVSLCALLAALALVAAPGSATAGTPTTTTVPTGDDPAAGDRGPGLELIDQTAWLAEDGTFGLTLHPTVPPAVDGDITIERHAAVASRAEFTAGLGEGGPGPVADTLTVPTALALGDGDDLTLSVPTGPDGPLPIDEPGVHPLVVTVDLVDGGTASILTHIVRVPAGDQRPALRVGLVVPIGSEPIVRASGGSRTTRPSVSRIERRVDALVRHPDVPLTLVPVPETLESLSRIERGAPIVDRLAGALQGRQVLSAPFVDLDEAQWFEAGLDGLLDRQFTAGDQVLRATLGVTPDRRVRQLSQPPGSALQGFTEDGVEQLVVPAATVAADERPSDGSPFPGPIVLAGPTGRLTAAVVDDDLRAHIDRTGDQVLDAHRTLADLATIALDRPLSTSGVVLTLADKAGLPVGYLDTLLAHLDDGPLAPVTMSDWFAEVTPTPAADDGGTAGEPLVRDVAPRPLDGLANYPQAVGVTELTLEGLAQLTDGEDPILPDLEKRLLVSGSTALTASGRSAYLAAVGTDIRSRIQLISTADDQTVTLTSREGRVPLTVRNGLGVPVRVRVSVRSERLEFPEGSEIEVELRDEMTTIEIPVQTRTTGSFQMDVTITSPDDVLAITATKITIRSTAVSGVGVVLSIGAGLVLLTWWLRHWHQRRRDPRLIEPSS